MRVLSLFESVEHDCYHEEKLDDLQRAEARCEQLLSMGIDVKLLLVGRRCEEVFRRRPRYRDCIIGTSV